ncbi:MULTISPECIES: hypothetical protein [Xanthomonas]|uniref:DUF8139 domain-containing protein n=1 Tax=Xanthomonas campestris pv. papavericola TaxID=487881 RepID=A0AAJ2X3Z5_XANCA|nr:MULTISPECIES: hypothetical protein [Xanthomonas]MBB4768918.1 hypothetical protein [Xanthomonas arboricola]MEC3888881.1 hypothetical protein [Xanthomonas campestris pv. papavericola]
MPKFNYDDRVRVISGAGASARQGANGWVVGVFESRPAGEYFQAFPEGVVYSIEFEDGQALEIHEVDLEALE